MVHVSLLFHGYPNFSFSPAMHHHLYLVTNCVQHLGFDAASVAPPPPSLLDSSTLLPPPPPTTSAAAALAEFNEDSTISEDIVRESLLDLVATKTCWGDATAKQMIIAKVEAFPALHYKLESFSEERKTQVRTTLLSL